MICCKIVTNYDDKQGNFPGLYQTLLQKGRVLWNANTLYFGSLEDSVNEKKVGTILKKNGFGKFFIEVFNQDHLPIEEDYINGWLMDTIVKITTNQIEQMNQKQFQELAVQMDHLRQEIDNEITKLDEEEKQKAEE